MRKEAIILQGKDLSQQINRNIKEQLDMITAKKPALCAIQIGNDPSSSLYLKTKKRACEKLGMTFVLRHFSADESEKVIINAIDQLNQNSDISGILVQLPIPKQLNVNKIMSHIVPQKDVDGLNPINIGLMTRGDRRAIIPCTAKGIVKLLEHYDIQTAGKHVVVIGRSHIVGRPLATLLTTSQLHGQATVTLCHSQTANLKEHTKHADIVVCSVGKEDVLKKDDLKPGSVVIDVGINTTKDGKLTGDVNTNGFDGYLHGYSPVPGGVGPMTVACLMENIFYAWQGQQ
ncbi:bifunctional 5,10-methylenetetrahydrofolate dehydrogenase/5,10-methenyltetrahydrofolate cyclohydrolase [Chlamydiia bacterium]|jgi:methylenetetrahydrofolate dehydrogenase (NADP+) / methenyltetrahydrofolate cyclohydrolase|nr:bifunctional 5,10-methylenetetrahydrofolate dehydrogenase/5,10-methenyltetrahydrofolate cyclohydrolase [Chlamydiia bacterium]